MTTTERIGEFERVTTRGKTVTRVIWVRACSVCGVRFHLTLPKGTPPEAAVSTTTCFEHSAVKRTRKVKRSLRARHRSPNRARYSETP